MSRGGGELRGARCSEGTGQPLLPAANIADQSERHQCAHRADSPQPSARCCLSRNPRRRHIWCVGVLAAESPDFNLIIMVLLVCWAPNELAMSYGPFLESNACQYGQQPVPASSLLAVPGVSIELVVLYLTPSLCHPHCMSDLRHCEGSPRYALRKTTQVRSMGQTNLLSRRPKQGLAGQCGRTVPHAGDTCMHAAGVERLDVLAAAWQCGSLAKAGT